MVERLKRWAGERNIEALTVWYISRNPQTRLRDKLVDHRRYIVKYGDDLPEVRDWKWGPYIPGEMHAPPELRG